jgi:hypothetical protein
MFCSTCLDCLLDERWRRVVLVFCQAAAVLCERKGHRTGGHAKVTTWFRLGGCCCSEEVVDADLLLLILLLAGCWKSGAGILSRSRGVSSTTCWEETDEDADMV